MPIFLDGADKGEFLGRFRNYLSPQRITDRYWRPYLKLHAEVALLCYCLMENHFHLLIHQRSADGMRALMSRTLTGYARYFNQRHVRVGPIFQARYAATPVDSMWHYKSAIAYIHLNHPLEQLDYPHSSHKFFMGEEQCDWVDVQAGLAIFGGREGYVAFMNRHGPRIVAGKVEQRGLDPAQHPYRPI